ncbi:unnamed protein product [Thlaspi arvense]|uniref:proline--tRNA ligase n=1 Tax=Thlaspi arvense TaxID=13288 RepID=A0AAU9STK8_THLAR|nr:unnamed protein product [Thlaspi arvense]
MGGHTAFATKGEADKEVFDVLQLYNDVYEKLLAVPVIKGIKSDNEIAGGLYTARVEAFIPSASRDKKGHRSTVWQNSWGLNIRSIGVMVMTHGDGKGLVFPPLVAPVQVIVITVPFIGIDTEILDKACEAVTSTLLEVGIRAEADYRDNYACGWKYSDWEKKGVPLRIKIGPRDLTKNHVRIVKRDTGARADILRGDLVEQVKDMLGKIQIRLFDEAKRKNDACTQKVETWNKFMEALSQKKLILAPCGEVCQ